MLRRFFLIGFALCAGCANHASNAHPQSAPIDPGIIRPPSALPYDLSWRQHVTAIWPTGRRSFDAVVQKQKGELLLVGLSPMGLPGFIIRLHENGKIDVENHTGRELPFRPEYILADVERVLFSWLPHTSEAPDREQRGRVGDLEVTERYLQNALVARTFARAADGGKSVSIDYRGALPGADVASQIHVNNGWFGYQLEIETIEESRLH
jgi:hypothetical protein